MASNPITCTRRDCTFDHECGVVRHQSSRGPHLGGEEIGRHECRPVRLQKRPPWSSGAAVRAECPPRAGCARSSSDRRDAQVLQRALNPRVAPRRVLRRHPNDKRSKVCPRASDGRGRPDRSICAPPVHGANGESCPASRASPPARAGDDPVGVLVRRGGAARRRRNAGAVRRAWTSALDSLLAETRSDLSAHDEATHTPPRRTTETEPRAKSRRSRRSSCGTLRASAVHVLPEWKEWRFSFISTVWQSSGRWPTSSGRERAGDRPQRMGAAVRHLRIGG